MSRQEPATETARENVRLVAGIEARAAKRLTWVQRLVDRVLSIVARESTLALHAIGFGAWLLINTGLLVVRPFDPFPFTLLTMVVSLEAIFLSLLVLASQNRLTQEADRRAHLDLQINLLAEQEMTVVLQMLKEICEHLGLRETLGSEKFEELVRRTDVGKLAEHVEESMGLAEDIAEHGGESAGDVAKKEQR